MVLLRVGLDCVFVILVGLYAVLYSFTNILLGVWYLYYLTEQNGLEWTLYSAVSLYPDKGSWIGLGSMPCGIFSL